MIRQLHICQLLISLHLAATNNEFKVELPVCPRHLQFFPQDIPMHCRMPRNANSESYGLPEIPTLPPGLSYPYYQSPSPDKQQPAISISMPQFPVMPPNMLRELPPSMRRNMPPGMPGMPPGMPPGMQSMPGFMPGMAGSIPMPLPMPVPMPMQSHKLPVIVMPFYSQDKPSPRRPPKKHRPRPRPHNSTESDTDSDSHGDYDNDMSDNNGSGDVGWWKKPNKKNHEKYGIHRRSNRRHNIKKKKKNNPLLTPILQYVTKDGYVIYEKKISKNEADNWLGPKDAAKAKEEEEMKIELGLVNEQESKPENELKETNKEDEREKEKYKVSNDYSKEMNASYESMLSENTYPKKRKPSRRA